MLSPMLIYEPGVAQAVAAVSSRVGPGTKCQGACNIHIFFLLLAASPGSRKGEVNGLDTHVLFYFIFLLPLSFQTPLADVR